MGDEVAAAQTSARKQEIKETKQEFERAKTVKAAEAKLHKAEDAELETTKVRELRLKVEKNDRNEKGQAEEAANMARRIQQETDLQIKEVRTPTPTAARRLHPKPPHSAH